MRGTYHTWSSDVHLPPSSPSSFAAADVSDAAGRPSSSSCLARLDREDLAVVLQRLARPRKRCPTLRTEHRRQGQYAPRLMAAGSCGVRCQLRRIGQRRSRAVLAARSQIHSGLNRRETSTSSFPTSRPTRPSIHRGCLSSRVPDPSGRPSSRCPRLLGFSLRWTPTAATVSTAGDLGSYDGHLPDDDERSFGSAGATRAREIRGDSEESAGRSVEGCRGHFQHGTRHPRLRQGKVAAPTPPKPAASKAKIEEAIIEETPIGQKNNPVAPAVAPVDEPWAQVIVNVRPRTIGFAQTRTRRRRPILAVSAPPGTAMPRAAPVSTHAQPHEQSVCLAFPSVG